MCKKAHLKSGFVDCTIRHKTLIVRNFQTVVGVDGGGDDDDDDIGGDDDIGDDDDDDDDGGGGGDDDVTQGSMDLVLVVSLWL